jgi:membrane protein implicated in regulation of membrane protease activity
MRGRRRRQQPTPFILGVFAAIFIGIIWFLSKASSSSFSQYLTIILTGISIIILLFSIFRLTFNKKQGLFGRVICIALIVLTCAYLLWVYLLPMLIQWFRQTIAVMIAGTLVVLSILVIALLLLAWKKGWFIRLPKDKPPSKEQLINMGGYGFEKYIGILLKGDDWVIVQTKGGRGDWGKDLIVAKSDPNYGKQELYIQCKNWNYRAPPDVIRNLNGALPDNKAGVKGVVICPSGFTSQAEDEAQQYKILTWEYEDICNLWKKATKQPSTATPTATAPPITTPASPDNWQKIRYEDLSQWVIDQFNNRAVIGKEFAYRINRSTGKFEKKLKRRKYDPWHEIKYDDLSQWAKSQFANIRIIGKVWIYRINQDTGRFEKRLK